MFNSIIGTSITIENFIICLITSFILGLVVSIVHIKTCKSNKNFISTLAILPMLVTMVILLVNGNLGTSVAIVGAFSLVRFRSIPGNSKEILNVFFVMAIGLACGTGYIGYALVFTLITALISLILNLINFGDRSNNDKVLKILIPENLDYTNAFNDIFEKYLKSYELIQSKTTNMGSLFELTYSVDVKQDMNEKKFIDEIRCRNGNLKISLSHPLTGGEL
ncbi:MAG: DUF4956 domain-containing protein [Bacilli bacterium]|nr:DUF4956 domain-containing protein [Bacilli bacterium]